MNESQLHSSNSFRGVDVPVKKRHLISLPIDRSVRVGLSLMERGFLMKSLFHQGTTQIFCRLRLEGKKIETQELERSLRVLQIRHPFLRCRPIFVHHMFYFEHDWKIRIPIFKIQGSWGEIWEKIQKDIASFWMSTAQVWISWDEKMEINELILSLSHAICDGSSAHTLIDELLELLQESRLSGEEVVNSGRVDSEEVLDDSSVNHFLPRASSSRSRSSLSVSILWASLWPLVETVYHSLGFQSLRIQGAEVQKSPNDLALLNHTMVKTIELSPITLQRLKKNCRKMKSSLTSVITSAHVSAITQAERIQSHKKLSLQSVIKQVFGCRVKILWPVQLRPLYLEKESKKEVSMQTSFLTFSVYIGRRIDGGINLWRLARLLSQKTRYRIRKKVPLIFSYLAGFATAMPLSKSPSGHSVFLSVSSLGDLDVPECGRNRMLKEFSIYCQVASCKQPSIITYTQGGKLIVNLLASYPTLGMEWMEQWERSFKNSINEMLLHP